MIENKRRSLLKRAILATGVIFSLHAGSVFANTALTCMKSDKLAAEYGPAYLTIQAPGYSGIFSHENRDAVWTIAEAFDPTAITAATPCGAPRCCLVYVSGSWIWVPC